MLPIQLILTVFGCVIPIPKKSILLWYHTFSSEIPEEDSIEIMGLYMICRVNTTLLQDMIWEVWWLNLQKQMTLFRSGQEQTLRLQAFRAPSSKFYILRDKWTVMTLSPFPPADWRCSFLHLNFRSMTCSSSSFNSK